jgi:hypothetical protein
MTETELSNVLSKYNVTYVDQPIVMSFYEKDGDIYNKTIECLTYSLDFFLKTLESNGIAKIYILINRDEKDKYKLFSSLYNYNKYNDIQFIKAYIDVKNKRYLLKNKTNGRIRNQQ